MGDGLPACKGFVTVERQAGFVGRLQQAFEASRFETRKALANELGVRPATAGAWFSGSWPREQQMADLVRALGVSGHWLVTGDGEMRPSDPDAERKAFRQIAKIVDGVRAAGEADAADAGDDPEESEGLGGGPGPAA